MANYIKYGDIDVDQEAYLKAIADNAETYLASRPWSEKQKNKWRNAYSDIVSQGITGASISTDGQNAGKWQINYNGNLSIDSMGKRDKETYQDAAYFLHSQMESLSKNNIRKQEETKKELPVFDNKTFTTGLHKQISNNIFGGSTWDTQKDWNIKDERDSTGKRGIQKRAELLAQELEKYRDSLEEGKYNFEGSPFTNLNNLKSRITDAVTALRTPDQNDDIDPLNRIGLKAKDYLYDGLDDIKGYLNDGETPVTYRQYAEQIAAQKALEEQQVQQQQELIQQQQQEEDQRKREQRNQIFDQMRQNIRNFREKTFGQTEPKATNKQLIANLVGIGADIASIIDPEPFSAAGLALAGSASRSIGGTNKGFWNTVLDYGSAIIGAAPLLGDAALAAKVTNNLRKLNTISGGVSLYDLIVNGSGKEAANSFKNVIDGKASLKDWENVGKALRDVVAMRGVVRNNLTERTALQQSGVKTKMEEGQIGKTKERLRRLGLKRTKPADSELEITSTVRMKSDTGDNVELKLEGESGKKLTEAFKGKSNKEKLETLKKLADDDPIIKKAVTDQGIDLTKIKSLDPSLRGSLLNLSPIRKITGGSNHGIVKTNKGELKIIQRTNNFENYAEARRKMSPLRRLWQAETQGNLYAIRKGQQQYLNKNILFNPNASLPFVESSPMFNIRRTIKEPQPIYKNRNLNKEERNISAVANALFPTSRQLTRMTKSPKLKGSITERIQSKNGRSKINTISKGKAETVYKDGSNVDHIIKWDEDYKTLFIDGKAARTSGLHEAKKLLGERVKEWEGISNKLDIRNKLSQEQVNRILDLKRQGFFLKHGGIIDNDKKLLNIIEDAWK